MLQTVKTYIQKDRDNFIPQAIFKPNFLVFESLNIQKVLFHIRNFIPNTKQNKIKML